MNTLGTVRIRASATVGAFDASRSTGVSVCVVDGTLSRSITPGSACGTGVGAGVCVCRVVGAGAVRVGRRGADGTGVVAITRTSGSVVSCWASTAPGVVSAARLTDPERPNSSLRRRVPSLPYAPHILVPPRHSHVWLPILGYRFLASPIRYCRRFLADRHGLFVQSQPGSFGKG